MSRRILAGVVLSVSLSGLVPVMAADSPLLGRWDVTVGDGQAPGWLGVQEKDGKLTAMFLLGGGSPHNLDDAKIEGGTITFKNADRTWTGKADGDKLTGTAKGEKDELKWTGKRFIPVVNVTGTWKTEARRAGRGGTLKLVQKGSEITGELEARNTQPVTDAKLEGNKLSFKVRQGVYKLTVKGDVLEGELTPGAGANAGTARPFKAERQREWGEPVELINGKNMDGWKVLGNEADSKWKIVDGILTNTDRGANIVTEKKFRDFKLHVEFRVPEHSNSGVYLRGRHEIQVEDTFGKELQPGMCGALYGRIVPKVNASKKAGEWQTFDVTLISNFVTIVHNDQAIIENGEIDGITGGALDNDENAPGPFYLQGDHGPVEYRKMTVTPVKPAAE